MMKRLGKWRCVCHLLASAMLWLGPALPAGDAVAQDTPSHIVQSPARNDSTKAEIRIWRTITLGTHKGVDAYRDALDAAGIKIGDAADEILGRPTFLYVTSKMDVELTLVSAADLGVESEAALADVYKRAKQFGLALCPPEIGPQLRLYYRDQPRGESLNIAMEPVATYSGEPTILSLINFGSGLALVGSNGRSEFMVPRYFRFVFALPGKLPLEARRDPR